MNKGVCAYEPCDRPAHSRGLCQTHYKQQHAGKELTPIKDYKLYAAPAPGKKICTRCERILDVSDGFYKRTGGTTQSWCKDCMVETASARYEQRKAQAANG